MAAVVKRMVILQLVQEPWVPCISSLATMSTQESLPFDWLKPKIYRSLSQEILPKQIKLTLILMSRYQNKIILQRDIIFVLITQAKPPIQILCRFPLFLSRFACCLIKRIPDKRHFARKHRILILTKTSLLKFPSGSFKDAPCRWAFFIHPFSFCTLYHTCLHIPKYII